MYAINNIRGDPTTVLVRPSARNARLEIAGSNRAPRSVGARATHERGIVEEKLDTMPSLFWCAKRTVIVCPHVISVRESLWSGRFDRKRLARRTALEIRTINTDLESRPTVIWNSRIMVCRVRQLNAIAFLLSNVHTWRVRLKNENAFNNAK